MAEQRAFGLPSMPKMPTIDPLNIPNVPNPFVNIPRPNYHPNDLPADISDFLSKITPGLLDHIDWKNYPYHTVRSRDDVRHIYERNTYDINKLNDDHKTALHVAVEKQSIELVNALLSVNAAMDIVDADGNTPLHIAAGKNSLAIVHTLLGFDVEVNIRNKKGDTPRHIAATSKASHHEDILYRLHAVGAHRCPKFKGGCTDGCSTDGETYGKPPASVLKDIDNPIVDFYPEVGKKENKEGGRLLALDGGGIKGVVLIAQLMAIQRETKKPILETFDWIAGTSTGGILACGLAAGKPLRELMNMYFLIKDRVFGLLKPFNDKELLNILKGILGENTVMSALQSCKLVVTGTLTDQFPVKLHLFRNYKAPSAMLVDDYKTCKNGPIADYNSQIIWQAARSSGAAPGFFEKFDRFMDGGLLANNPTMDLMTDIHDRNVAFRQLGQPENVVEISSVVSLGCGVAPVKDLAIDIVWPSDPVECANDILGIIKILTLLGYTTTNGDNCVVDRARAWCSMIDVPYNRFSPTLHANVDFVEKDDEVLASIIWETRAYMHHNLEKTKKCAETLV